MLVGVGTGTDVGAPVGVDGAAVGVDVGFGRRAGGAVEARELGDAEPVADEAPVELGEGLGLGVVVAMAGRGWSPPVWSGRNGAVGPSSSAAPSMTR